MANARGGQPAISQPPHPFPGDPALVTAPRKSALPVPEHLESEQVQGGAVHRHPVIPQVPPNNRPQPCTHLGKRIVQAPSQLGFDRAELRLQPPPDRLPHHREPSIPLLPADVREAEEIERLRLPLAGTPPVLGREGPKLQQSRLLGVQLQTKLRKPLAQLGQEPLSLRPVLKPHDEVVRVPHDDPVPVRLLPPPPASPEVEHVVQVHVRQEWRNAAPLRCAGLTPCPRPVRQHASVEPLLDQPHDAPVRNPMLEEFHQPPMVDGLEESTDVGIEHPVHLLRQQPHVQRIQRVMWIAPRSEAVREVDEVRLIDGVQHLRRCALDDFVLQRGNAQRPRPPVGFGYVRPFDRLRPIRPALQPFSQVRQALLAGLPVVLPRLAIDPRRRVSLQRVVRDTQMRDVIDVVQERREPHLLVPCCGSAYPLQRTARADPARCPGRVLLVQAPFSQAPSLHPLRSRYSGVVRRLRRYYGPVRLPRVVHRRRVSIDFPTRPATPSSTGNPGLSRFSREMCPSMLGVSDRAGLRCVSRYRRAGCGLPPSSTASASRRIVVSRLNTRPALPPVNASRPSSPTATHDSGPVWAANPSPYDSCIRNTSPV